MSNLERDSLVLKIEQLEQQQQVLAKYIVRTKRQLDELSEQFNNRAELEQLAEIKDALAQMYQQLDGSTLLEVPAEVVSETTEENRTQQQSQQKSLAIIDRRRRRLSNLVHSHEEIHQQQLTQARASQRDPALRVRQFAYAGEPVHRNCLTV